MEPITLEELESKESRVSRGTFFAFDIPNPNEVLAYPEGKIWHEMSHEERRNHNELSCSHQFDKRWEDRADPLLVQVVEELGEKSYGEFGKLKVVEIPDGTDYEIDDYDGMETIHEKHHSWS